MLNNQRVIHMAFYQYVRWSFCQYLSIMSSNRCDDPALLAKKLRCPAFLPRSIVKTAYFTWRKFTVSFWCSLRNIWNVKDLQTFFKLQKTSGQCRVNVLCCCGPHDCLQTNMAVCQNLVPLVNIKIAGKWMFIPLKMVLIGIDPYPCVSIGFSPAKWIDFSQALTKSHRSFPTWQCFGFDQRPW